MKFIPGMHMTWHDDSLLWILCVSWCQIERAARLRLRLGNLLHLHAIRDSKTWNDADRTRMTAGEIHSRDAYDLAHVCISWSVHTNKWHTTHNALCGYYKFSFRIFIMTARNYKTSFIIPWWQVSFFFSWQAALLEEPWLHFHLTLIPLLISPKPLTI
jgi:hypothetical protein